MFEDFGLFAAGWREFARRMFCWGGIPGGRRKADRPLFDTALGLHSADNLCTGNRPFPSADAGILMERSLFPRFSRKFPGPFAPDPVCLRLSAAPCAQNAPKFFWLGAYSLLLSRVRLQFFAPVLH